VITPPQEQLHVDPSPATGVPPTSVVALGGFHGPTGTGTQGIGVSTPAAATVAEATVGLERLVHKPKGGMFTIGRTSSTVATGLPSTNTRRAGSTFKVEGAIPKEHTSEAVDTYGSVMTSPHKLPSSLYQSLEPLAERVRGLPRLNSTHVMDLSRSDGLSQLRGEG